MDFSERLQEIFETREAHRRFKELEEVTGVAGRTWSNISYRKQKANQEHIEALCKAFPQYAYWLVTGQTDEQHGHTSPVLERIQIHSPG